MTDFPAAIRLARPCRRQAPACGFTLIELMVTIAIIALLLGLAAPSFTEAGLTSKLRSSANNLVSSVALAKSEAIKRNTAVTLCVSTNGSSCAGTGSWEEGWIVLVGSTVLQYQQAAPAGLRMIHGDSLHTLSFPATGVGVTASTVTVCQAIPSPGSHERKVTIGTTGSASVSKTTAGECG